MSFSRPLHTHVDPILLVGTFNNTFWNISGKIFVPEYLGPRCRRPWWIELDGGLPADAKGRACALGTACHSAQSAARTNRTRSRPVQTIIYWTNMQIQYHIF